jgi:chaperonin GroES
MGLKPLEDRLVVKRYESEEKSEGGIFLPETAKEKPQKGEVVAVGQGKILENGKRAEMLLKKGDKILFGKYSGTEVTVGKKDYIIMRENEVLAKIK